MNKLSALDAYKVSVILDGVSNCHGIFDPLLRLESGEALLLGDAQVQHGRRDGRDDVTGDNEGHGPAEAPREGVRPARHHALRTQGPQQQTQAARYPQ